MKTNRTRKADTDQDHLRWVMRYTEEVARDEYSGGHEYIEALHLLHCNYGDRDDELVLDIERQLTDRAVKHGVVNRYADKLSKAAGTYQEAPPAPTLVEACYYLGHIGLSKEAIRLVKSVDGDGPIYAEVASPLLKGAKESILRAIKRSMPDRLEIKSIEEAPAEGGFAEILPAYRLGLMSPWEQDYSPGSYAKTSTWEYISKSIREDAAAASKVFKADQPPKIDFQVQVIKEEEQRIVTGVILEPETVDASKDEEEGTEGDIYSAEEITKAMHWWMENASSLNSYHHIEHGGRPLGSGEVIVLENWQARADFQLGTQNIKKGTWLSSMRINNDALWDDIKASKIKSWSIGAQAMGAVERMAS